MSMRLLLLVLAVGIGAVGNGQTSADLNARYRKITSYELQPDVVMTPRYAADGQVCEMALERRQNTDAAVVFAVPFSEEEVRRFVDEVAPEGERGRNLTRVLNSAVDGDFITTTYTYENVLVRVYGITRPAPGGDRVIVITWPKRACSQGQNSATAETVDPKSGNRHPTIPAAASIKPKQ